MEAKELRIGNLIKTGMTETIMELRAHGIKTKTYDSLPYIDIIPIRIEKYWLFRFGGEIIEDGFDSDEGGAVCVVDFDLFRMSFSANNNYWKVYRRMTKEHQSLEDLYLSRVSFIHEWQNLYFALTGLELELKELSE